MTIQPDVQINAPASEMPPSDSPWTSPDPAGQCLRRLLTRMERLEYLSDLDAPAIIIRNERRMVDAAMRDLFQAGMSFAGSGANELDDTEIGLLSGDVLQAMQV